jgi:hypothetical protein
MDLSVAILAADTALYGFVIAYYAFSRSLHEQEKSLILARYNIPIEGHPLSRSAADQLWLNLYWRALMVDLFLIVCTVLAIPSALLGTLSLLYGINCLVLMETLFFVVFLVVLSAWMLGVGALNFSQNISEFLKDPATPKRLRGVLRWGFKKK